MLKMVLGPPVEPSWLKHIREAADEAERDGKSSEVYDRLLAQGEAVRRARFEDRYDPNVLSAGKTLQRWYQHMFAPSKKPS